MEKPQEFITISKLEFDMMEGETRKLQKALEDTRANLDAANAELNHLKDKDLASSSRTDDEDQADVANDLVQNLVDELISTCKIVHVPSNRIRPKLAKLDALYSDELNEHIRIARLLLHDINQEVQSVYGRKPSNPPVKISQVFTDF